jgi:hypothetical protein
MIGVVAHVRFSETYQLAPRYKFFAAGAILTNQSLSCDR